MPDLSFPPEPQNATTSPAASERTTEQRKSDADRKVSIRTMTTDVQELLKTQKPTLSQMIAKEPQLPFVRNNRTIAFIILGVIGLLFVSGAVGLFLWLRPGSISPQTPTTPATALMPPKAFFATEAARTITVNGPNDRVLFNRLTKDTVQEPELDNTLKRIIVKIQNAREERHATMRDFLQLWNITPPTRFVDRLNTPIMVFLYTKNGVTRMGFAAQSSDLDRTLADMLGWERTMLSSLKSFLFDEEYPPEAGIGSFEDRVYRNIDWRYLKLSQEKDLGLAYFVFPAKNLLIFTTGKTFTETVINRLYESQ